MRKTAQTVWWTICCGLLGFLWLIVIEVFWGKMAPRLGYLFVHRPIANDPPCITPECDFSAFWPAGLLARQHDFMRIYDATAFLAYQRQTIAPSANLEAFFYPPPMLFPSVLISYLPFEWAFFTWTALGLILAAWLVHRAGFSWPVILAGVLSPAALWNTELGQLGVIGGAVLLAGIALSLRKPLSGGALLGVLACKPQIGVLVPAMLAGQRNWRAGVGFGAVCLVLFGGVMIWFGPSCLRAYRELGSPHAFVVLNAPFNPQAYMNSGVSVFWMARSLGAGLLVSYAVQGVCSLFAMAATIWLWTRGNCPILDRIAITVFLSLLATPYGYGDDMVAWSWVLASLAERQGWRIGLLDVLFWLWPMLCPIVVAGTGLLFTPVVVVAALARTLWGASRQAKGTSVA